MEMLLTESDGPFVKIKDKDCGPMDIPIIIAEIAEIYKKNANEIKDAVFLNFRKLLS